METINDKANEANERFNDCSSEEIGENKGINEQEKARNPVFDRELLDKAIQKASSNLSKIKDVDTWINEIKTGDTLTFIIEAL